MPECNLPLPCSSTCTGDTCASEPAFTIVNPVGSAIQATGATFGLRANSSGALVGGVGVLGIGIGEGIGVQGVSQVGRAGQFQIGNINNNNAALFAETRGGGVAVEGFIPSPSSLGEAMGRAGFFHIENPNNNNAALFAETRGGGTAIRGEIPADGTGRAGFFSIENPESFSPVVTASTRGGGAGLFSAAPNGTGIIVFSGGGLIVGNVDVVGTFTADTKFFVIDHPLDPENRSLAHASVESSEMANVYSGNASLDDNGEAWVELPAWLEALNADFRYQLTCIGQFAPVYVAEELANSRFKIAGGKAGMKVSWQLTGIRKDPWAQSHPLVVEQEKPANERGSYRHPELYNQPQERDVLRSRYAEMMEGLPPETLSR